MENTTKKAFIVCIAPVTRVVVDTKGKTTDEIEEQAIQLAVEKMRETPNEYLIACNCEEVIEDYECPAEPDEEVTPNY